MIIWDSKKRSSKEVVIGSFFVLVKFLLDGCGPLWLSVVYGPNSPLIRKDFWVELLDLFGLTFPLWCVVRDGNGAGHFGYPPLMGWDIIFLNGYGTGLRFFLKPKAGSGIAPPHPAPPRPDPIIYKIKIKIKFNLKFKINLI